MRRMMIAAVAALLASSLVPASAEWRMVWNDEFDGSGPLDLSKWNFEDFEPGAHNNELQKYTWNRRENCRRENGVLILEGRRDGWWDPGKGRNYEYTSARIQTAGKFAIKYGKIEMRAIMPWANGAWSAFWMMPQRSLYGGWPDSGEIDILEYVGWDNDIAHFNAHSRDRNFLIGNNYGWSGWIGGMENSYHVYTIEWWHDRIDYYIDGVWRYGFANEDTGPGQWPYNTEFFLILNHAIGGDWGAVMGVDAAAYDTTGDNYGVGYLIDWVRAYKWDWPDHDIPAHVEAEHYEGYGGDIREQRCADHGGGWNVGHIDTGDYMQYNFNIPAAGWYQIDYRIASVGGGVVTLGRSGNDIKSTVIPDTGGWQNWRTVSDIVLLEAGKQTLDVYATSGGWNLDHFKIHPSSEAARIEAEYHVSMSGVQHEPSQDAAGGLNVGFIDDHDWMTYVVDVPVAGTYTLQYRVASASGGGVITLGKDGTDLARTPVPATGGWQNWQTIQDTVVLEQGTQWLTLYATAGGWNLNWWSFEHTPGDYEIWEAHYGIAGAGPAVDLDGDGRNNAWEYAFGTHPLRSGEDPDIMPGSRIHTGMDGRSFPAFDFTRRSDRSGLRYVIETSMDLTTWTPCIRQDNGTGPHTYTLLEESTDLENGSRRVSVRYNRPAWEAAPESFFFRLKAVSE